MRADHVGPPSLEIHREGPAHADRVQGVRVFLRGLEHAVAWADAERPAVFDERLEAQVDAAAVERRRRVVRDESLEQQGPFDEKSGSSGTGHELHEWGEARTENRIAALVDHQKREPGPDLDVIGDE